MPAAPCVPEKQGLSVSVLDSQMESRLSPAVLSVLHVSIQWPASAMSMSRHRHQETPLLLIPSPTFAKPQISGGNIAGRGPSALRLLHGAGAGNSGFVGVLLDFMPGIEKPGTEG